MPSSAAKRRTLSLSHPSRSMSRRAAARISGREVTEGRPIRPPGNSVEDMWPSGYFRDMSRNYHTNARQSRFTLGGGPLVLRPRDLADVRPAVHGAAAAGLSMSVLA